MTVQPDQTTVTRLLRELQAGDRTSVDALFELVYDELYVLARRQRKGWHGDYTLNTTALVHEVYLKLIDQKQIELDGRAHFFALASKAMRHILSNYAKTRRRQKRGGEYAKVSLEDVRWGALGEQVPMTPERADVLVLIDEALQRLEQLNARQSRVVECRFYGGMTVPETATALGVSAATIKRDWTLAQAWLYRELKKDFTS